MPKNQIIVKNNIIHNFHNYANESEEKPITLNWFSAASGFKGRAQALMKIQEYFKTTNMVVICGMPGIGKTETARHFGTKNSGHFEGNLIWIFAATQQNIQKSFDDLATTLDLKRTDASQAYSKFKSSRCLFVFDNAEDMAAITDFLPPDHLESNVKILITSQFAEWDSSVGKVFLDALEPEEALDIFREKIGNKFDEYCVEIWYKLVKHLEGIPLSIKIVSSLLYQKLCKVRISKFDLDDFINSLTTGNFINAKFPKSEKTHYKESVLSSIYTALDRLKKEEIAETDKVLVDLLCWISYLNADYISHEHLLFTPTIKKSNDILEEALIKLADYSLIQLEKDNYFNDLNIKVHRTVQLVLRKYDLNEQDGLVFKTVLETILSCDKLFIHLSTISQHVKMEEYEEKSIEIVSKVDGSLVESYLFYLARYHCTEILRPILLKYENEYKNEKYNKILNELLFTAICNKNNNMNAIDLLINYGAKIEYSLLEKETNGFHIASDWLSIDLFNKLLKSNGTENIINSVDESGHTILHILVKNSNKENVNETIKCIENLINQWNADISIRDDGLNNILHTACRNMFICIEMILYLVAKCNCKKMVNIKNKWNQVPLQRLTYWDHNNSDNFEIVSYFIKTCEADITIQDDDGCNTLFSVCRRGTSKIIDFLLRTIDCRDIINIQDRWGNLAFTYLICNNLIEEQEKLDLMNLFIENKMNFKITNNENQTLVEIAEVKELLKLTEELKKH